MLQGIGHPVHSEQLPAAPPCQFDHSLQAFLGSVGPTVLRTAYPNHGSTRWPHEGWHPALTRIWHAAAGLRWFTGSGSEATTDNRHLVPVQRLGCTCRFRFRIPAAARQLLVEPECVGHRYAVSTAVGPCFVVQWLDSFNAQMWHAGSGVHASPSHSVAYADGGACLVQAWRDGDG